MDARRAVSAERRVTLQPAPHLASRIRGLGEELGALDAAALSGRGRRELVRLVELGRAPESIVERGLKELVRAQFLSEAIQDADWVIEAIHEDVAAKQKLLVGIEQEAAVEALISSSSSGLSPTEIFGRMRRLDRCLVTHPLNPPELIPLVEVVPEER